MISKTGYREYKASLLIIVCISLLFSSGAISTAFPLLNNGKLYIAPSVPVPIEGIVLEFSSKDTAILYVAKNDKAIVAGAYMLQDKKVIEQVVSLYSENTKIVRSAFESNAVYICIYQDNNRALYRCDINTGTVTIQQGIVDFILLSDGLVLLKSDTTLVYNDFTLPLYFLQTPTIKGQIDNRLVLISDGNDTEVVDITTLKAVYRYSNAVQYAVSTDHTIEIAINDLPTGEKATRVFYKIYCNGQDYGRTEPALSINKSTIQLNVASGQYHEIIIERWRLDETDNQYVRDNNIRQPKPITVFVYPGRIMVFTLVYNGIEYKVVSGFKILEK
ncbi:MAG: hypothetical protein N3F66_11290 [Spirochaetes bacterium]|nr:hypothetical protein [Spirochaetota bacterium]